MIKDNLENDMFNSELLRRNDKTHDPEEYVKSKIYGNTYYTAEGEEIEIISAKSTTEIYIKTWGREIRKCALYDLESGRLHSQRCVYDHLGNRYKNNREKAAHYGIGYKTYIDRIRKGWSEEVALTTESRNGKTRTVVDHLGNRFETFTDMCKHYGKNNITCVTQRLNKGWSLEKALTMPSQSGKKPVNYEGVEYSSRTELFNTLGISPSTVRKVMNLEGLSFVEAVDKARTLTIDNSVSAFGKKWPSCQKLAEYYGLYRSSLSDRINLNGQDPEEAVKEALECKLNRGSIRSSRFEKIKLLYVDNTDSYYLCFSTRSEQEEVLSLTELQNISRNKEMNDFQQVVH